MSSALASSRSPARILPLAVLALTVSLASCSPGTFSTPEYLSVTITPRPTSAPVGSTVVFSGSVSNQLGVPAWSLLDTANSPNLGTLAPVSGSPNSILYTAPASPPIYSNTANSGLTQGAVTIVATVAPPPLSTLPAAKDTVTVILTAASVTVGLSPATATVALGTTLQLTGYAVGNVNGLLTWQVNGVTGGSLAAGTITSAGLYTAPASSPMSGNTVTITAISQADSTKSASAVITLD